MEIFNKTPVQWGLRGDPHLWDELRIRFENIEDPKDKYEFDILLDIEFENLLESGSKKTDDKIWFEHFPQKGMSGGWVSLVWWRDIGLPFLKDSYLKSL